MRQTAPTAMSKLDSARIDRAVRLQSVKKLFKRFVERTATNPVAWFLYRVCGQISNYLGRIHRRALSVRKPKTLSGPISAESIPLGARALIISDCEGYEGVLFNRHVADYLARHDVVIEIHDLVDIELSIKVRGAFAKPNMSHRRVAVNVMPLRVGTM